jgi:hypothetical protein
MQFWQKNLNVKPRSYKILLRKLFDYPNTRKEGNRSLSHVSRIQQSSEVQARTANVLEVAVSEA